MDCIHLIEGRIQWWIAVIWLRVGFSGGMGLYGSGKIQWWTAFIWFRIEFSGDCIHLRIRFVGCSYMLQVGSGGRLQSYGSR